MKGGKKQRGTHEQVVQTEKHANKVASVTSGLKSPTKTLKCPDDFELEIKGIYN